MVDFFGFLAFAKDDVGNAIIRHGKDAVCTVSVRCSYQGIGLFVYQEDAVCAHTLAVAGDFGSAHLLDGDVCGVDDDVFYVVEFKDICL